MSDVVFQSVSPIGDTDIKALPVSSLGPAIAYYTQVLGFSLVETASENTWLSEAQCVRLRVTGSANGLLGPVK